MHPFHEWNALETRRQFFARGKNVVGWAALSSLLAAESKLRAGRHARSRHASAAGSHQNALRPQSEKCDLPPHGGWSGADGYL